MTQFIALCGYPKAGKSEVQAVISQLYGFTPIDDSAPLRSAACCLYGLTDWHVSTQEGKSSLITVGGRQRIVRDLLGELGAYLEKDDEFHLPRLAVQTSLARNPQGRFVFGSVRQNQARFFKETGKAIVIEVVRPGGVAVGHYDHYDRASIDATIKNAFDPDDRPGSRRALEAHVRTLLDPILLPEIA